MHRRFSLASALLALLSIALILFKSRGSQSKMARIFITGSSDGLGARVARDLIGKGHAVTLHARNASRAKDAQEACPGADGVLVGDLSSIADTKHLAAEANKNGTFDVVIHNAGLYHGGFRRTPEGWPALFAVNVLAPYMLTSLMNRPKRLVYVSSGLHSSADTSMEDLGFKQRGERGYNDNSAYSDSKLYDIMLAFAVARKWNTIPSNALSPGWVATKMGGFSAPGDIEAGVKTYVDLALGQGGVKEDDTGKYWASSKVTGVIPAANDEGKQEILLKFCEAATGVKLPEK